MQAMLMIHTDEAAWKRLPEAEVTEILGAYRAYADALREAGAMRGGERLQDAGRARSVRVRDGAAQVLDGPYAETREQLGGFFIIEVADMAQAVEWAARCPGARVGTVEVRPIWQAPYREDGA